jgi:hypothetical protein
MAVAAEVDAQAAAQKGPFGLQRVLGEVTLQASPPTTH